MTCHSNRIDVRLEFDEPFDGIIFADQAYNDSICRWEGQHEVKMNFSIPISESNGNYTCGIILRQVNFISFAGLSLATGEVTVMLIISPMKNILVNGVTSLQIRCLYAINDITITMANVQLVSVFSSLI
ncbi:unnamed protein product [Onchocerca flexuosa]|uniref:ZP domain-containing protein n=1 Tax=Onchocerca flexuosa TaxID=387005 RepID=A0A183HPT4_9BILA|nr:unnamed protein product [Onchocerca flexuosa]